MHELRLNSSEIELGDSATKWGLIFKEYLDPLSGKC